MRSAILLLFFPLFVCGQESACKLTKTSSFVGENLQFEFTYFYDTSGKLLSEKEIRSESQGTYELGRNYEYNEKGFLSKITNTLNGVFHSNILREYDRLGNMVSEVESTTNTNEPSNRVAILGNNREKLFYEDNGSVGAREIEVKDNDGNIILKEIRGSQGELFSAINKSYSAEGNLTYSKSNDIVGKLIEETFYEYDASKKLIKDSTALNGQINARTLYTYNEDGFLIKKSLLDANFVIEYVIDYQVDKQGNVMEEKFTYRGQLLNRKVYTYLGKLKTKEEQYNKEGVLERTRTWVYNCN